MRNAIASLVVACMLTGTAAAQQPPPQPAPQPQPQAQQQQAPWYRFTLNDGRVIDVQVVGGDATSYHILQAGQLYSIPKTNVVGSIALAPPQAQPQYAPPPQQYAQPVPYAPLPPPPPVQPAEESETHLLARRRAGWGYFGSAYILTAIIVLARVDEDRDSYAGLIPVVGPVIWTVGNDSDDFLEDGWDWLGLTDALIQGAGLVWAFSGPSGSSKKVSFTPTARRNFHGLAISGTF